MAVLGTLVVILVILLMVGWVYVFLGTIPVLVNEIGTLEQAPEWVNSSNFFAWSLIFLLCLIAFSVTRFLITMTRNIVMVPLVKILGVITGFKITPKMFEEETADFDNFDSVIPKKYIGGLITINLVVSTAYTVGGVIAGIMLMPPIVQWLESKDIYNDFNDGMLMKVAIWYIIFSLFIPKRDNSSVE